MRDVTSRLSRRRTGSCAGRRQRRASTSLSSKASTCDRHARSVRPSRAGRMSGDDLVSQRSSFMQAGGAGADRSNLSVARSRMSLKASAHLSGHPRLSARHATRLDPRATARLTSLCPRSSPLCGDGFGRTDCVAAKIRASGVSKDARRDRAGTRRTIRHGRSTPCKRRDSAAKGMDPGVSCVLPSSSLEAIRP